MVVAVAVRGALSPAEIAARSQGVLDRPLTHDAELILAHPDAEAVLLGAFERDTASVVCAQMCAECTVHRRGSGGAAVTIGPGTLWMSLALARTDALVPCTPDKLLNRYVRPLLRALGRVGALAHYFGRDWVSVAHRPAAAIGFAHDTSTGRAAIEAFVAVSSPFAIADRASFLSKSPGTLVELLGKPVDMAKLARAVADAYAPEAEALELSAVAVSTAVPASEPPWAACVDEAIGELGAGPDAAGRFRVGGQLMVSRDALASLEARLAAGEPVEAAIDAALAAPGVALMGVKSLRSLADVIARARAASEARL